MVEAASAAEALDWELSAAWEAAVAGEALVVEEATVEEDSRDHFPNQFRPVRQA